MKANELMIGDWVQHRDEFNKVTGPYKIDLISKDEIGFENEIYARSFNNEIEPIPLTAEILEKNGFEKRTIGKIPQYVLADDYFDIFLNEYTDSIWRFEYNNAEIQFPSTRIFICYVHELRHALRLCGIDKEIVL